MNWINTDKINDYFKRLLIALLTILIYLNSSNFQNDFLHFFQIDITSFPSAAQLTFSILWEIVLIAVLLLIYHKSYSKDIADMKKNHSEYYHKYLKYWLISVGIMFASNILILAITGNMTSAHEKTIRDSLTANPIYIYFSGVIFAPIIEELIFRKCFREMIPNKYLFILISGFVFGGLHVMTNYSGAIDLLYLIPYCAPGIAFAYIMAKTDNVLVSTGLHFLHNGLLISGQIFVYLFLT